MIVRLPIRISRGQNEREHWAVKAKRVKLERQGVCASLRSAFWQMNVLRGSCGWDTGRGELPAVVTLTRIAPRFLDEDNLIGGLKGCRDGVADALGIDDADPRVTWRYAQAKGKPKEYALTIQIEERR